MSLSDKMWISNYGGENISFSDVKEAIKELKNEFYDMENFPIDGTGLKAKQIIDKIMGDKLTK